MKKYQHFSTCEPLSTPGSHLQFYKNLVCIIGNHIHVGCSSVIHVLQYNKTVTSNIIKH